MNSPRKDQLINSIAELLGVDATELHDLYHVNNPSLERLLAAIQNKVDAVVDKPESVT